MYTADDFLTRGLIVAGDPPKLLVAPLNPLTGPAAKSSLLLILKLLLLFYSYKI